MTMTTKNLESLVSELKSELNDTHEALRLASGQRDAFQKQLAHRGASPWFIELSDAIERAREKHPGGAEVIRSLVEEVGEYASALRRETPERQRAELIDVAVVAMRLWMGEAKS